MMTTVQVGAAWFVRLLLLVLYVPTQLLFLMGLGRTVLMLDQWAARRVSGSSNVIELRRADEYQMRI